MLNSGSNSKVVIGSLQNKLIHGFGMSIVYLILIPIAIYWARYLKSYQYWFVTHATMQIFNYVSIIVFFIVILLEYQEFNIDHAILGLLVLSLTTVQVFFGGFTRLGMIKDDVNTFRILKYCHQVTGLTVVLLSIIQVGLGLYILYPLYDGRGIEFWIIYGVIVCFWIIVFVSTEVYYHKKVYYSKSDKLLAKPITNKQNKIEKVERVPLDRIKHLEKNQNTEIESLKTFTWDEIDENVRDGKILVVANGNYVYDASVWIKSHPGGKLILYSVAGTDISLDFFYSAGFDAQSFVVQKPVSSKSRHSALSQSSTIFNGSIPLNNSFPNQKPEYRRQVQLTDQECNVLTKSRRTNVHSRLALERLSSLMVGQLSATKRIESQASPSEDNNFTFSCSEYRRFALVSKTLKSESINHIVWNMKFTLLYPFDVRESQPVEFSPGEMIEMQIRTLNGEIINKLFYPMNGDLSCFEILVTVSNDPFDQYLNSQRIGDKQFKIRGPMLKPFIPSVIGVPKSSLLPENLIFIRLLYLI